MNFVLMHRNRMVAAVKIDEITGVIYAIGEIYDSGHLPLGTNVLIACCNTHLLAFGMTSV